MNGASASADDAHVANGIAHHLGFDVVAWHRCVFDARHLSRERQFRLLADAIRRRLIDVEILFRDELIELAEATV